MSADEPAPAEAGGSAASWLSLTNSVTPEREPDAAELPTPAERVNDLIDEYPELARTPIVSPGTKVRREATVEPAEPAAEAVATPGGPSPTDADETVPVESDDPTIHAAPVAAVVAAFLDDYESNRGASIRLEKVDGRGEKVDETEKSAENSFAAGYRKKRYAQLLGFEREIGAAFDEPVVALFGLTASGTDPDGSPRPPGDHMREIAEAWSESGGVRETLRNQLEHTLDLSPSDWAYVRGGEPHLGDGANAGYHHDHPAVVVDAAAADGDVTEATFAPVVEKHVAETPTAKPAAHRDAVTVREIDPDRDADDADEQVGSLGRYVGAYIAPDADRDLLEEPTEYLVWAATTWATTTQKFTAGRTARAMIDADRCRSEAEDGRHGPHGAKLNLTTDAWGRETVECAYCGSHHDTPETHAEGRRSRAAIHREPAAPPDPSDGDGERAELAARWRDADAAGRVGGSTRAKEYDRPPDAGRPISEEYTVEIGGGEPWCPACKTVNPSGECPNDAYETHPVMEPDRPAREVTVRPRGERRRESEKCNHYRGDGHLPIPDDAAPPDPPPSSSVGFSRGRSESWRAVEVVDAEGETHPVGTPGSVEYQVVNDVPRDVARSNRMRVNALRSRLDAREIPESRPRAGERARSGDAPADTRRAVLDALTAAEGRALDAAAVAERVDGLDAEAVADRLDALATAGRCHDTGDGWVAV